MSHVIMTFTLGMGWLWTFVVLGGVEGSAHWVSSSQVMLKSKAETGASAEPVLFKRVKRADVPSWILDCEGLDCLYKILRVLTYRFPVNTVGLWDDIFETYNARDALKKQLQIQKINTMRAEHEASMVSIFREIELLDTEFESEQTNRETGKLGEKKSSSLDKSPESSLKSGSPYSDSKSRRL
eukprot:TCALIF_10554-PA protein Name:"Protein of unknown function" AED:0.30 eAED:0.30 QI:10/0.5/0/0.66/1/0.66/3/0/182